MAGSDFSRKTEYIRGKEVRRGGLEEQLKFESIWKWMWYKFKTFIYKIFPILTVLALIVVVLLGILWAIANWGLITSVGTRSEVGLEQSGIPGKLVIGLRDAGQRIENWVLGFGEWKSPTAKEERIPRGIEVVEFKPRRDFPYRIGEEVEMVAAVKVYALSEEDLGSSKITFTCEYEDGKEGEIIVDGLLTNEAYASNDREENFNVRCTLPAVEDVTTEEAMIKDVNFYASYSDFVTVSTLHTSILGEEEYLSREKEGTLLDFLRKNSVYPKLIKGDRSGISEYTNGPVKLTLSTGKLPLTENRLYSFGISFVPEVSEWTGEIKIKELELSPLPQSFEVTKCDLETDGRWFESDLNGCDKGCERICDFNIVGAEEFIEYEVKARAVYDYTMKETSTVTIREI